MYLCILQKCMCYILPPIQYRPEAILLLSFRSGIPFEELG